LTRDISGMAVTAVSDARIADMQPAYPPRAAVISRIFFDWAAQPYFTLITTFVFAPHPCTSDPASGQALLARVRESNGANNCPSP
jgi:UMF1 family MFS transporter